MGKCRDYPFCGCGAELMRGMQDFTAGPTWVQFEVFEEEPLIMTETLDVHEARKLRAYLNREVDRVRAACPAAAEGLPVTPERGLSRAPHVSIHDEVNGHAHLMIGGARYSGRKANGGAGGGAAS